MKVKVQLVVCDDDGHDETVTDVVVLEKACQRIEQVGLTLAEAKAILTGVQQRIVERQMASFLALHRHCQACGLALRTKGHHSPTFRTLFGTIALKSPRLRRRFHKRVTVGHWSNTPLPESATSIRRPNSSEM